MVKTIEELEALIKVMKTHKVRTVKLEGVEISLSNAALYLPDSGNLSQSLDTSTNTVGNPLEGTLVSGQEEEMDEDTLFHSAN